MGNKLKKHQCNSIIEKGFKEAQQAMNGYVAKEGSNVVRDTCKRFLDGVYKNRIKKALIDNFERIQKDYSWLSSSRTPFDFFARTQLIPYFNYNMTDYAGALRVGAAIWMLEELDKAGKLEEAKQYLIEPNDVYQNVDGKRLFNVQHLRFPANLIESMALMITFRYFPEEKKVRAFHLSSCVISDDMMSGKKLDEKYKKIIELLPEGDVKNVCEDFRQKLWEVTTILVKCQDAFVKEIKKLRKEVVMNTKDVEKIVFPSIPIGPVNELKGLDLLQPNTNWDFTKPVMNGKAIEYVQMVDSLEKAEQDFRDVTTDIWSYFHMTKDELLKKGIPENLCDDLLSFDVDNPFAYCFALFQLVDMDDDAPWLLYSGSILMMYVYGKLPWGDCHDANDMKCFYGRNGNGWIPEYEVTDKEIYQDTQNFYDYYKHRVNGLNIAQILYRSSEIVIPYDMPVYPGVSQKFLRGNDDLILEYYIAAATGLLKINQVNGEIPKKEIEEAVSSEKIKELEEKIKNLQADLESKEEENKKVKNLLNEANRSVQKAETKLKETVEEFKNDKRELSDLREYVFNAENEIAETIKDNAEKVSYPYDLQKTMVVFGGHDTFINVMKANFPALKFYESRGNVNSDIVKYADIVWIQPNCISHPQFWNATRYAKSFNKPVRYFVAAGTERCSRQIIEADRE